MDVEHERVVQKNVIVKNLFIYYFIHLEKLTNLIRDDTQFRSCRLQLSLGIFRIDNQTYM